MQKNIIIIISFIIFSITVSARSVSQADSLLALLQQHQEKDTIKVNLLNKLAYQIYRSDIHLAKKYIKEAEKIADSLAYLNGKAESLRLQGILFRYQDMYSDALELYMQALDLAQKTTDSLIIAKILNNIGIIYKLQKDYDGALSYLSKSLDIYKKNNNKFGAAKVYNNLGLVYKKLKKDTLSLMYCKKAYEQFQQLSHKQGILISLVNIGSILGGLKKYDDALKYFIQALELSKSLNDNAGICTAYIDIGNLYFIQKKYKLAQSNVEAALKIAEKNQFLSVRINAHKLLSDIYSAIDNCNDAYENYVKYRELSDSLSDASNLSKFEQLKYELKLQKEKEIIAVENRKKEFIQKILITGISLLFVLLLGILFLLWQKSKANAQILQLNNKLKETNNLFQAQKTELKTALDELKKMQIQLLQKEKMASIGILTAGIAHEINNPLNFISVSTFSIKNLLAENNLINEEMEQLLNAIETGVDRILTIVKGLNDFSSKNNSNDELCDIHSIIDNSLLMLYSKYNERIVIEKDFIDQAVVVKGNVGDLHQVFINLFLNSIEAISNEGKISIRTEIEQKNVVITISDTGVGIEENELSKIIEPFYTTKDPGKGVGLGLSIAYSIIERHNGTMICTSSVGKGTTIVIRLPLF